MGLEEGQRRAQGASIALHAPPVQQQQTNSKPAFELLPALPSANCSPLWRPAPPHPPGRLPAQLWRTRLAGCRVQWASRLCGQPRAAAAAAVGGSVRRCAVAVVLKPLGCVHLAVIGGAAAAGAAPRECSREHRCHCRRHGWRQRRRRQRGQAGPCRCCLLPQVSSARQGRWSAA